MRNATQHDIEFAVWVFIFFSPLSFSTLSEHQKSSAAAYMVD